MEKTIVELCPKCGRPLTKEIDEKFDRAEVYICEACNWRYYRGNEKYTFVTFRVDKHKKDWKKRKEVSQKGVSGTPKVDVSTGGETVEFVPDEGNFEA